MFFISTKQENLEFEFLFRQLNNLFIREFYIFLSKFSIIWKNLYPIPEIHLINVVKASLKELVEDYEDYLKTRNFQKGKKESKECYVIRELGRRHNDAVYFMNLIKRDLPQTIANMAVILINQAVYLLLDNWKG